MIIGNQSTLIASHTHTVSHPKIITLYCHSHLCCILYHCIFI
jgi:hypothetical protein